MTRFILIFSALLLLSLSCASSTTHRSAPASQPATAPSLQPLSFVRNRVGVANDSLKVVVEANGAYQITRRGGGGANSSTRGQLTETQQRDLARAFAGWDQLQSYYSPPGGVEEEFRFEIDYAGKMIIASDAAKNLPEQIREAYRQIKNLVSARGML